jgi:hypothetical protein
LTHLSLKIFRAYIPNPIKTKKDSTNNMITKKSVPLLLPALGCALAVASIAIGDGDCDETESGAIKLNR